ncbi:MAG: RNA polymerase sigma factor RpoH [Steroidobacteraceae bacterium]
MNVANALVPRSATELALTGPIGSFDAYVDTVSRVPVLSREDELALATRFHRDGDLEAARELVLSHLRFVLHIARGYAGYGLPMGDLVQEGNIGLMKAVKRFDPSVGVRLVSFAVHWIRAEIHEYVLRNWRLVKVATTKAQRKLFFNLRRYKRNLGWLSAEETKAVARDLGVSEHDVTEMERRLSARDVSYDPVPDAEDEDSSSYSPAAYLPAADADPAVAIENAEWDDDVSERVALAMTQLDDRSRAILKARWMDEPKATLHDLADRFGVSAVRIRQIEATAIKKLKKLVVEDND